MILLIISTIIAIALQQYAAGAVIILIIILNAVLGVAQVSMRLLRLFSEFTNKQQERRAGEAMDALSSQLAAQAMVIRDGHPATLIKRQTTQINNHQPTHSSELVPGDIVLLELGAEVPADIRLISAEGVSRCTCF